MASSLQQDSTNTISTTFASSKSAFLPAAISNADERIATQRMMLEVKKAGT
jgi:hypothetical protein